MAKKNMMLLMAQEMCKKLVEEQTLVRLSMSFDAAIIAANKAFHMGPGRFPAFSEAYNEALQWLGDMFISDARENHDAQIEYAKGKRDQLILSIVGENHFTPFDAFYSAGVYVDELKRARLLMEEKKDPAAHEGTAGSHNKEGLCDESR